MKRLGVGIGSCFWLGRVRFPRRAYEYTARQKRLRHDAPEGGKYSCVREDRRRRSSGQFVRLHQTVSLVARHLETNGIPPELVGIAWTVSSMRSFQEFLFQDFPLGNSLRSSVAA